MTPGLTAALAATLVAAAVVACRAAAGATRRAAAVERAGSMMAGRGDAQARRGRGGVTSIPRLSAPGWMHKALADAGWALRADDLWSIWAAGVVAAVIVASVAGTPALGLLGGAVVAIGPFAILRMSRGRGAALLEAALPEALESVARALRSGASLRQAVGEAARTTPGALGHELARVSDESEHGRPLAAALEELADRRPLPGIRLTVAALCLGAETGGAQAQAVDGVATTIRERLAVAAEARALASQARMSAMVIGLAPLGFGVFAGSTDPRTAQFLFHTSAGLLLLLAGLTLDGLGWLWMQRLCTAQQ